MFRTKENELLERLVKLSDRPWIQQRAGEPYPGDWYYDRGEHAMELVDNSDITMGNTFPTEKYVWMPLDWHPEKCRWQVDELCLEAGGFKDDAKLLAGFDAWRCREVVVDGKTMLCEEEGSPAELHLMFLNWLIDQLEEKHGARVRKR